MVKSINIDGWKYLITTKRTEHSCTKVVMKDALKNKKTTIYISAPFCIVMDNYAQIGRDIITALNSPYWASQIISVTYLQDFNYKCVIK